jgi:hypothetical protein
MSGDIQGGESDPNCGAGGIVHWFDGQVIDNDLAGKSNPDVLPRAYSAF